MPRSVTGSRRLVAIASAAKRGAAGRHTNRRPLRAAAVAATTLIVATVALSGSPAYAIDPPGIDPDTGLPYAAGTPGAVVPGAGVAPSVAVPNAAPLYSGPGGATLDNAVPGHVRNGGVGP